MQLYFRAMSASEPHPLTATSLADEIASQVRADILSGRIALGARLPQDELCTRFGVSRTPVREALRQLQATNVITLAPSRGAVVRTPTRKELIEVYELRADMEGFACGLACVRWAGEGLDEPRRAQAAVVEALDRHLAGGGEAAFDSGVSVANDAFHEGIRRAADNARLAQTLRELDAFFPKGHVWQAAVEAGRLEALNRNDHEAILEALAGRRPTDARRAMTAHIAHAGSILVGHLDRRGFWS
jgi:DNA-binding GntR family transcriptional regulator